MFVVGLTVPEAVALIDEVVLGVPRPRLAPVSPRLLRRRTPRSPRSVAAPVAPSPCPLDSVVLTPPSPPPKVTPTIPAVVLPRLHVSPHVSGLIPGYCWLAAVPDHCWHYVAPAIGPFPSVRALRTVPEFFPFQAWLEPVRTGLYHLVTASPSQRAIPYALGILDWKVGASHHLPFRPIHSQAAPLASANSRGMAHAPRVPDQMHQNRAPHFPPLPSREHPGSAPVHPHTHRGPAPGFPPLPIPPFPPSFPAQPHPHAAPHLGPPPRGGLTTRPPSRPVSSTSQHVPRGISHPTNRPRQSPGPRPMQAWAPYSTNPADRRKPPPRDTGWKKASRDALDDTVDELKASLSDMPSVTADPLWADFLTWLSGFPAPLDRLAAIPAAREWFSSRLLAVRDSDAAAAAAEQAMVDKSQEVGRLINMLAELEESLRSPASSVNVPETQNKISALRDRIVSLESELKELEASEPPASVTGDAFASGDPYIPLEDTTVETAPWPYANWENYLPSTENLFPTPTGKPPLDALITPMDDPQSSKLLLPRPLELYSLAELRPAVPRSSQPWFNRYEDPLEPCKSWSRDLFTSIYSKPGFHFMFARVARSGPQSTDPKLHTLRSMLISRWKTDVTFESMDPRQDWMMCTIPSVEGLASEILTTALMRMAKGNASYVIRHFGPITRSRDLDISIKGSSHTGDAVYDMLRKRVLHFESSGISLGWRVLGVRRAGAPSNYRASFLLDSPTTYWPWSHQFGHPHGAIPAASPLLNFEPVWEARKPYACQLCYNSDHFKEKCPLSFIRIGGVSVISFSSKAMVLNKRPAECLVVLDRSLKPIPAPPPPFYPDIRAPADDLARHPLSVINESAEPPLPPVPTGDKGKTPIRPMSSDMEREADLIRNFICAKLYPLLGPSSPVKPAHIRALAVSNGCLFLETWKNLHTLKIPRITYDTAQINAEWEDYLDGSVAPPSISFAHVAHDDPESEDAMSYAAAPMGSLPPASTINRMPAAESPPSGLPYDESDTPMAFFDPAPAGLAPPPPQASSSMCTPVLSAPPVPSLLTTSFVRSARNLVSAPAPLAILPLTASTNTQDATCTPPLFDDPILPGPFPTDIPPCSIDRAPIPAPHPSSPPSSAVVDALTALADSIPAPADSSPPPAPHSPSRISPVQAASDAAILALPSLLTTDQPNPVSMADILAGDQPYAMTMADLAPARPSSSPDTVLIDLTGPVPVYDLTISSPVIIPTKPALAMEWTPDSPLGGSSMPLPAVAAPSLAPSDISANSLTRRHHEALDTLKLIFPAHTAEFLSLALDHRGGIGEATAWLFHMKEDAGLKEELLILFPSASEFAVNQAVGMFPASIEAPFDYLRDRFDSMLGPRRLVSPVRAAPPEPAPPLLQPPLATATPAPRLPVRTALLSDDDVSEFQHTSPSSKLYETRWWNSRLRSMRYRVTSDARPFWDHFALTLTSQQRILFKNSEHVRGLANKHDSDNSLFRAALKALSNNAQYAIVLNAVRDYEESAVTCCRILLEDGLISPQAACWLSTRVTLDSKLQRQLRYYPIRCDSVWKSRNEALHAWKADPEGHTARPAEELSPRKAAILAAITGTGPPVPATLVPLPGSQSTSRAVSPPSPTNTRATYKSAGPSQKPTTFARNATKSRDSHDAPPHRARNSKTVITSSTPHDPPS